VAKRLLKLPGPVATLTPGGGGRYVAFQIAQTGAIVLHDAKTGVNVWTLNGANPDDLIAVSRQKLYIGKLKDSRVDVINLANGGREGSANLNGAEASLKHLAIGSASDGPLLMITQGGANNYRVRLLDATTFAALSVPIDSPTLDVVRSFPFTATTIPPRVAMSADGRALTMDAQYLVRTDERYRGGKLTGAGIVSPAPDGQAFFGTLLFNADGLRLALPVRPAGGGVHRYFPTASGQFMYSVEYKNTDLANVKLFLHVGTDPNPLGPLPGGEEVGVWAKRDPTWSTKLHQRLVFLPDPGLVLFAPPGSDTVSVFPVDVGAMLRAEKRDLVFTSVAPSEVRAGRPYDYTATVTGTVGPVTFSLEAGPPGMQITKGGYLSWAAADPARPAYEVRIAARDADGRRAVQTFRLVVWKETLVVANPNKDPKLVDPPAKKEPDPIAKDPNKEVPGAGQLVKLPAQAVEVASGGNGRFILLNLQAAKQVTVFDLKEGKVVKNLPVEADAVIAAGRDHLFVVSSEAKTLERWSLATLEKESTDKLPPGGPFGYAVTGSNSTGPLLLCPKAGRFEPVKPLLLDVGTLRVIPFAEPPEGAIPQSIRVSSDGQAFTWATGRSARGAVVATVVDGKAQWKAHPTVVNPLAPSADRRFFYAFDGAYDNQLRRVFPLPNQPKHTGAIVPAAQGNLFLDVEPSPAIPNGLFAPERVNVFFEGRTEPFTTIGGLNKPMASPRFIHLAPRYGALVMLNVPGNALAIHPFDLDAALAKSPTDYLLVLPDAPPRPVAGQRFEYAPLVKSKKGGVKFKLDAGPDGMKVAEDGRLTWDAPADAAGKEFAVALTVSDASGQSVPQTFRLVVAARGAPVAPAPPDRPMAPPPAGLPVAPPPRER
jgi:hypothetical protein